jgi:hypothetical protein
MNKIIIILTLTGTTLNESAINKCPYPTISVATSIYIIHVYIYNLKYFFVQYNVYFYYWFVIFDENNYLLLMKTIINKLN